MSWYKGKPLLELLETLPVSSDKNTLPFRFQVQHVLRSKLPAYHDYRGYAGKIASGTICVGDTVTVLPAQCTTTISGIDFAGKRVETAEAGESVSIQLSKDLDLSRGDMIAKENSMPTITRSVEARLCWLMERPAKLKSRYLLQHGVRRIHAKLDRVKSVIHPESLEEIKNSETLAMNDIGDVTMTTAAEVFYDRYQENKANGAFIIIDESTNDTVGVGVFI